MRISLETVTQTTNCKTIANYRIESIRIELFFIVCRKDELLLDVEVSNSNECLAYEKLLLK